MQPTDDASIVAIIARDYFTHLLTEWKARDALERAADEQGVIDLINDFPPVKALKRPLQLSDFAAVKSTLQNLATQTTSEYDPDSPVMSIGVVHGKHIDVFDGGASAQT